MITTKWPRLLVVGEPVTREQASEILIRTNSWWCLFSNDKAWQRAVNNLAAEYGYPPEIERDWGPGYDHEAYVAKADGRWRKLDAWQDEWQIISGEYLHNSRVMSSFIGGPHGWCNWDGHIGTSNYNIGKWPTSEDVTDEWTSIAEAFPYLDLTAQCIDDEGEGVLAAEWRVKGGRVEYVAEPDVLITPATEPDYGALMRVHGERGVGIDRMREAFETTRAAILSRREAVSGDD